MLDIVSGPRAGFPGPVWAGVGNRASVSSPEFGLKLPGLKAAEALLSNLKYFRETGLALYEDRENVENTVRRRFRKRHNNLERVKHQCSTWV